MNGEQFETAIIQQGYPLKIVAETITDKVDLKNNIISTGVIIENCVFEEVVFFEGIDLNCGLVFKDCIFKKSFSINSCIATKTDNKFNFDNYHLEFINTTIEGLYFNGDNNIDRGIRIKENSIISKLQVKSLKCKMGSFAINNSTINILFDIGQSKIQGDIAISESSVINAKIRFESIESDTFLFTESDFYKDIHIWGCKIFNLTFSSGIFNDDLFITGVSITNYLTVIGTEFKKSILFKLRDKATDKLGKLSKIYISSSKFGKQFTVNGNETQIDNLELDTSKQLEGALYFNKTNIVKSKISGDNYNGNIVFNHTNFNELIFEDFFNYSTLSIISSTAFGENSNLTIAHSNLGKTQMFNMDLSTFDKTTISNSVLIDIITANVKWFEDNKLNPETLPTLEILEQKKEIYRQLKFALDKQGNRISSLRFKALEMKTYKKETFIKIKWYQRIFNVDRFVLWVGQSNDYGLNWFKPVLFAIGFSIFFHFLIIVGISDDLSYSPNLTLESIDKTCNIYQDNFKSLPQLMNPTHFIERVYPDNKNLNFIVYLLDYLLKLVLAFFIFQIISAFRKYIK